MGALTGDFVFVGDLGRPDLLETAAGMSGVKETGSIKLFDSTATFLGLDDHLQVWPAHGAGSACGKSLGVPQPTVGYERQYNAALQHVADREDFVRFILDDIYLLYFGRTKVQNRDGVPLLGELPAPRLLSTSEVESIDGRKTVVLDTRSWDEFRKGHLDGALFASPGPAFHGVVGSYLNPDDEIVLVAKMDAVDGIVRGLVRIGLDNVAGMVTPATLAEVGALLATTPEVTADELARKLEQGGAFVLDVRGAAELGVGSVSDEAVNIAHTRLPRELDRVPEDRPVLVHCASGVRSAAATAYLRRQGRDAVNIAGGYGAWSKCEASCATQPQLEGGVA